MAITITATPDALHSVYRPALWKATSDDGDTARMKVDVLDSGNNSLGSYIKDPELGTSTFKFDVQDIVRANVNFDITTVTDVSVNETSGSIIYKVKLTEQLEQSDGTFLDGASKTSATKIGLNATLQHTQTQDLTDHNFISGTSDKKFLTNAPTSIKVDQGQLAYLYLQAEAGTHTLEIETFTGGVSQQTASVVVSFSGQAVQGIGVGPANIDAHVSLAGIDEYDVWVENVFNDPTEKKRFKITRDKLVINVPVFFVNELGGMDTWVFKGSQTKELRVGRTEYEKILDEDFNIPDRGVDNLSVDANNEFVLSTWHLTDDELDWLQQLITSRQVWVYEDVDSGGKDFVPVQLTSTKKRIKELGNRAVMGLTIEYRYSNKLIRHTA